MPTLPCPPFHCGPQYIARSATMPTSGVSDSTRVENEVPASELTSGSTGIHRFSRSLALRWRVTTSGEPCSGRNVRRTSVPRVGSGLAISTKSSKNPLVAPSARNQRVADEVTPGEW